MRLRPKVTGHASGLNHFFGTPDDRFPTRAACLKHAPGSSRARARGKIQIHRAPVSRRARARARKPTSPRCGTHYGPRFAFFFGAVKAWRPRVRGEEICNVSREIYILLRHPRLAVLIPHSRFLAFSPPPLPPTTLLRLPLPLLLFLSLASESR